LPLIGSPMSDVCGIEMCHVLDQEGALGILHRFQTVDSQKQAFEKTSGRPYQTWPVRLSVPVSGNAESSDLRPLAHRDVSTPPRDDRCSSRKLPA
jgi:hypothetical protein